MENVSVSKGDVTLPASQQGGLGETWAVASAYLLQNAHVYIINTCNTSLLPKSIFALISRTASFTHTYNIQYTHTCRFIFVSIFWVLQLPAGL